MPTFFSAKADELWRSDFDDNSTSEYAGDSYGWGAPFNTAVESNGTMKLSDPVPFTSGGNQLVDFWFDTGHDDDYFPSGSWVTARIRINSDRTQSSWSDAMFTDDWEGEDSGPFWQNNQYQIISFVADQPFSRIGFEITWQTGSWNDSTDFFEIDWLQIESPTIDGNWTYVGLPGFSENYVNYVDMAFHPINGDPYVAYSGDGGKASVMRFDGTGWVNVGSPSFSTGMVDYVSIAFSTSTSQPYVAYSDRGLSNSKKATVMRFDGNSWVSVGSPEFSAGETAYNSMAFNPSTDRPCVSFSDGANSGKATVMCFDGSDWQTVGSAGFNHSGSTENIRWTSLAFHPDTHQPFISFAEDVVVADKVAVMRFDGSAWTTVGSAYVEEPSSFYSSLAFDPSTGEPNVAYTDSNGDLAVSRYNGASWEDVGSPGINGSTGYTEISLAFNPSDNSPCVAFGSYSNFANVSCFDGVKWKYAGSPDFSEGGADYISLVFNPITDKPYVAFSDISRLGSISVMRFDALGGGGGNGGGGGGECGQGCVTLDINATIAISCDSSVAMDAIVGTGKSDITLSGNNATDNMAMCNIKTNASGGYKMEWSSSATHESNGALKSTTNASDTIGGYTLSASSETWSIDATASEWGAKLGASSEGYGTGNGGGDYSYATAGGWGANDGYTNGKWMNVPTTSFQIMQKSAETDVDGEYQYLVFGAEIGADKLQPTGTYTQEVTVTATTL